MGNVIAFPIAGWISASSIGWPHVFYLYGAVGVVWSAIWFFVGSNSPAQHNSISPEERKYIESGIEGDEDKEVSNVKVISIFLFNKVFVFSESSNSLEIDFLFSSILGHTYYTLWTELWFLDIAYRNSFLHEANFGFRNRLGKFPKENHLLIAN